MNAELVQAESECSSDLTLGLLSQIDFTTLWVGLSQFLWTGAIKRSTGMPIAKLDLVDSGELALETRLRLKHHHLLESQDKHRPKP
jgi:hypothetical protein